MFTSVKPCVPASFPFSYTDARSERHFQEHKKLVNSVRAYTYAHPALISLGDDPFVAHLVASAGFSPVDVVVLRVLANGDPITVLAVPTRVWRNRDDRVRLLDLKRQAKELQTSCILVPQRWLRADIRGGIARVIARARHTVYSHQQLHTVLAHLGAAKISTLSSAACVLNDHQDPYGAVLAMVAQGYVHVDRSGLLHPESWIAAGRRR